MKPRSAIKTDLFADELHRKKINTLGDPLAEIESYIDFVALAAEVDCIAPIPVSSQGRFAKGIEPDSVAIIVARWDLLKTSGYSRCPEALIPNPRSI